MGAVGVLSWAGCVAPFGGHLHGRFTSATSAPSRSGRGHRTPASALWERDRGASLRSGSPGTPSPGGSLVPRRRAGRRRPEAIALTREARGPARSSPALARWPRVARRRRSLRSRRGLRVDGHCNPRNVGQRDPSRDGHGIRVAEEACSLRPCPQTRPRRPLRGHRARSCRRVHGQPGEPPCAGYFPPPPHDRPGSPAEQALDDRLRFRSYRAVLRIFGQLAATTVKLAERE